VVGQAAYRRAVRAPAVAGTFYPGDAERCRRAAQALIDGAAADAARACTDAGQTWCGGIVPHAGWVCSGAIAAQTIAALAASTAAAPPDVVVVFGAIHTPGGDVDFAALDVHEAWAVPGGETRLARDLADRLCAAGSRGLFAVEERLHRREHAVEVELPLIQRAWPAAALLPVEVPPTDDAVEIGRRVAEHVGSSGLRAVYLASSDLTHYGPSYRFAPAGVGTEALEWAKANDRRLLSRVTDLAAERVVPETREHANACGGGAIAAMLAACRAVGATSARVLRHASSYETLAAVAPQPPVDAVGYASVVVG
jgi:AmmeMemoRadiSam system protein B